MLPEKMAKKYQYTYARQRKPKQEVQFLSYYLFVVWMATGRTTLRYLA